MEVEGISTGALSLDLALGGKGLPRGRIIELFGPESSGKTTIALHAVAQAQRDGGVAAFIDAEHALDPSWCKRLGVDIESLLVSQPGSAEEALQIAEMLVLSNAVDIIVIDSVAALVPRAEIEGEIGDSFVGVQARLMSQALRKLTGGGLAVQVRADLHQPDPREDRRDVRQPRDDSGRPGAEVLQLVPHRRPPHRTGQGWRGNRRLADQGQGRQEQGRAAVPRLRVRHDVHPRHLPRGRPARPGDRSTSSSRSRARGSTTATSGSARAARTPSNTCATTPTSPMKSPPRSLPTAPLPAAPSAPTAPSTTPLRNRGQQPAVGEQSIVMIARSDPGAGARINCLRRWVSSSKSGPGGTGNESKTCDSAVNGTKTPGLDGETGNSVLIRPWTLATPCGAERSDVVAPATTASGGIPRASAP